MLALWVITFPEESLKVFFSFDGSLLLMYSYAAFTLNKEGLTWSY